MISIVTTAINRPAIVSTMIQSLFDHSNVLEFDCEWLINVDRVKELPQADRAFSETVEACRAIGVRIPVLVLPQWEGGGPAKAISRLRERVGGDVVLFLEDDWRCCPEVSSGKRLDLAEIRRRLDDFSFTTLRGRKNKPSLQPSMMRRSNFMTAMDSLKPCLDAEDQFLRNWALNFARNPTEWGIHPAHDTYFADLGWPWRAKHNLHKWERRRHYLAPISYGSRDKDPARKELPRLPRTAFRRSEST